MTQESLSILSNHEIDMKISSLFSSEKELFSESILFIREVNRRKSYLTHSYSSLFEYLTKFHGYSAGSAHRRIDACMLSYEVPTVIEDLESGVLNQAQVTLVQKAYRQSKLAKSQKLSTSQNQLLADIAKISAEELSNPVGTLEIESAAVPSKAELLDSLKDKSISESQAIVEKALGIKIKSNPVIKTQADDSVRLEVTFSKEEWEQILRMRDLLSHSLPNGSWDQLFVHVAKKVIAAKTNVRDSKNKKDRIKCTSNHKDEIGSKYASSTEARNHNSKDFLKNQGGSFYQNRKILLKQNSCCQYQDKITKRTCTSTWKLQIDHIRPRWAGGTDEISNLRVVCGVHNRAIYREQAGIRTAR